MDTIIFLAFEDKNELGNKLSRVTVNKQDVFSIQV